MPFPTADSNVECDEMYSLFIIHNLPTINHQPSANASNSHSQCKQLQFSRTCPPYVHGLKRQQQVLLVVSFVVSYLLSATVHYAMVRWLHVYTYHANTSGDIVHHTHSSTPATSSISHRYRSPLTQNMTQSYEGVFKNSPQQTCALSAV